LFWFFSINTLISWLYGKKTQKNL